MRTLIGLCLFALAAPVLASNPGEPLDCSDWVFLEPGLSCAPIKSFPCNSAFCSGETAVVAPNGHPGNARVADNEGNVYRVRHNKGVVDCGMIGFRVGRIELTRIDTLGNESVTAYIDDRCNPGLSPPTMDVIGPSNFDVVILEWDESYSGFLQFLPTAGRLLIPMQNRCYDVASVTEPCTYSSGYWLAGINGFTTTFEVLQTFTPTADAFSFRVPYMPEGFQFADFFDTYTGDLATVGDWSQAQGLQCGYPALAPSVGDYLTVADTLPDPAPGHGRYYVTAVTYLGQTRYGRKNINGVLSGRDPAALPGCP